MLSPFPWNGPWHTLHYFATHLSNMLPVVYVEPSPAWNPLDPGFKVAPLLRAGRIVERRDRLIVVRPYRMPLERFPRLHLASERTYLGLVGDALATHGLRRPLGWATYYRGVERHVQMLGAQRYVYHCLDYFDRQEETHLAENADVVLAVSRPLRERQRVRNPRTFLVPNGVAMDWVTDVSLAPTPEPRGRSRTLGFVGTLNRNIDFGLLLRIARRFSDATLRIVGPVVSRLMSHQKEALDTLARLPNVEMLGFRQPTKLFADIATFDVCLLPFVDNHWISHSDPIKFYQYLALGKPVVTTPVPAAVRYSKLCYVADSPAMFISSIEAALAESADRAPLRTRVAAAHDWRRLVKRGYRLVGNNVDGLRRDRRPVP